MLLIIKKIKNICYQNELTVYFNILINKYGNLLLINLINKNDLLSKLKI